MPKLTTSESSDCPQTVCVCVFKYSCPNQLARRNVFLPIDSPFINHFTQTLRLRLYYTSFTETCRLVTASGQLGGMIVKWYAIAIIVYAILMAIWILSGSNSYNMIINMIAGLSGIITIIIVIEVLKRKIKLNN